jgi:hypothetical protein
MLDDLLQRAGLSQGWRLRTPAVSGTGRFSVKTTGFSLFFAVRVLD